MSLSDEQEAYAAYLNGSKAYPDDELLLEDLQKAKAARDVAWLEHKYKQQLVLKGTPMKKVLAALQLLLADVAKLQIPTVATAVAGILIPIIAALFGQDFDPYVLAGYLTLIGTIAGMVQKLTTGQAAMKVALDARRP